MLQLPFIRLRDELIVKFFFATGVRISELCDLTLDQISLKDMEAVIISKKSQKPRIIMWDSVTNELLARYLDMRSEIANDNYVFISKYPAKKISSKRVQIIMKGLFKKAGIKERLVCHSWRHGYINHGLQNNVQVPFIARMVGHTNWMSSATYEHLHNSDLRKMYNKVYARRLSTV